MRDISVRSATSNNSAQILQIPTGSMTNVVVFDHPIGWSHRPGAEGGPPGRYRKGGVGLGFYRKGHGCCLMGLCEKSV